MSKDMLVVKTSTLIQFGKTSHLATIEGVDIRLNDVGTWLCYSDGTAKHFSDIRMSEQDLPRLREYITTV